MTPVAKGGAILGGGAAIAAGGYGTKALLDGRKPYTLADVEKYKEGGANATKFGGKFAPYLLSDEEFHKAHNRPYWESNARRLLVTGATAPTTSGFLSTTATKKGEYDSASEENKTTKFNDLITQLIADCKAKYDETTFNTAGDASKWQEYWKYCSIDGKDRWNEHQTSPATTQ